MSKQKPPRKAIPDRIKLIAALRRFGLTIDQVQFDHHPALGLRPRNEITGDTIPPANDPDYIDMLLVDEHKIKTFGRGGEKRITTADGDLAKIRKADRISEATEEFRKRLLTKQPGEPAPKKSRWPSRPFPKRKKTPHE